MAVRQGKVTKPVTKKQQAWALRKALESEPRNLRLTAGQRQTLRDRSR